MKSLGVVFNMGNFLPFILAAFLFVGTTGIVSSHYIGAFMVLVILTTRSNKIHYTTPFQIVYFIIILSFLNEIIYIFFVGAPHSFIELIPYSLFIFLTMWAARIVDEKVLRWMLWFTLIDVGSAIVQRIIGVNTFLPESMSDVAEMGGDLLYDLKVNGLNTNSSGLGYKAFLALLIYERFPRCRFCGKFLWYFICLLGIILAFNRTMLIATVVYFGFKLLQSKNRVLVFPLVVLLLFYVLSDPDTAEFIVTQITRGGGSLSEGNAMSGREEVYAHYIQYCKDHFFLGNGSFKYYLGEGLHAHNSFLQTMATNGIVITTLYVIMLLSTIKKQNVIFIIPFLVSAMTQSFILWGASYNDFIMYCLMLKPMGDVVFSRPEEYRIYNKC